MIISLTIIAKDFGETDGPGELTMGSCYTPALKYLASHPVVRLCDCAVPMGHFDLF